MENYNTLKAFINKGIEDWGCVVSDDYKSFQTKYKNFIKKVCQANGYELVNFSPNHYEFSCFIKGNDKYVYMSISDVRHFKNEWYNRILVRYAKNESDYHGEFNQYVSLTNLEAKLVKMLG